ncbi:hypothetical protein C0989_012059 [Termitomyces sp. Mn162]|nr:hypothetical protein C0989_012059 [Termitomyces sp. Mn162]
MPLVFDSPPISTATAHLLTFIFGFIYVGSLYVSKHGRLSFSQDRAKNANGTPYGKLQDERWRDDPSVIRARFLAGTIATILNCGLVFYILWSVIDDRSDLAYTTLFGFHCSYMFLRTGSVYPSITAHIFCNIMGLPEISWELRTYSTRRIG